MRRQALDERKVVERAKGILMKQRGMSEEAAYALLRKAAMNDNRRISRGGAKRRDRVELCSNE